MNKRTPRINHSLEPPRAVAYLRVPNNQTVDLTNIRSCEAELEEQGACVARLAESDGATIERYFVDESPAHHALNREVYRQMLDFVSAHGNAVIYVDYEQVLTDDFDDVDYLEIHIGSPWPSFRFSSEV